MIFRMDRHQLTNGKRCCVLTGLALAALLSVTPYVSASSRVQTGFTSAASTLNADARGDSVYIAAKDTQMIHVWPDSLAADGTYRSDCKLVGHGQALFLNARISGTTPIITKVFAQLSNIQGVTETSTDILVPLFTGVDPYSCLSIVKGKDDSSTVFSLDAQYQTADSSVIIGSHGTRSISTPMSVYNSMAFYAGKLFLFFYRAGSNALCMRRIHLTNGSPDTVAIAQRSNILLSNGSSSDTGKFISPSACVDSDGNVIVAVTRGTAFPPSNILQVLLVDTNVANADNGILDSFAIDSGVTGPTVGSKYISHAAVACYSRGKFACLYEKADGMYLCTLAVIGSKINLVGKMKIDNETQAEVPALAVSPGHLWAAWRDWNASRIQCKRFTVVATALNPAPDSVFQISDAGHLVDSTGPELGFDVNEFNDVVASWGCNNNGARHSIWFHCPIRKDSAQWISQVDSVPSQNGDSVTYLPGTIDASLYTGTVAMRIRFGPTVNVTNAWSAWILLTDATTLAKQKRQGRYYQLRADLKRAVNDSIMSPALRGSTIKWDVQPRLVQIDSLRIGGKLTLAHHFSDTIDAISGIDTVVSVVGLYDPDQTDRLYVTSTWPLSGSNNSGSTGGTFASREVTLKFA